ncbi:hypothetical protein ACLK11_17900 [Escherichia coli]
MNANCNLPDLAVATFEKGEDLEATIRLREELAERRHALLQIQEMAAKYGFRYLLARRRMRRSWVVAVLRLSGGSEIAEWRRRSHSGRTASFLDIYIERDFKAAYQ